jgi:MFS family permease
MDTRNRIALYACYFLGLSGIGFTLPFLPLYLGQIGFSDRAIGLVSTLAALAGLAQFPLGIWSDRVGRRKPFLVAILTLLAGSALLLPLAQGALTVTLLVILFAENGFCRASLESLAGAEAAHLAKAGAIGKALGGLRFWRPVSIVLVAFGGGCLAERYGVRSVLWPVAMLQVLAVIAALAIREDADAPSPTARDRGVPKPRANGRHDFVLWTFTLAMVLFHVANAPPGVYLGLYLKREFLARDSYLSYAFIVSMIAWTVAVSFAGRLADRWGRKPLLVLGWTVMTLRLALIALATSASQVLVVQIFDGLSQALFAVAAAAWVTDRLADPRRVGEAQVLVGSALVLGSAIGPLLAGLVIEPCGYRGMFWTLAGVGALATGLVVFLVPESLPAAINPQPALASGVPLSTKDEPA